MPNFAAIEQRLNNRALHHCANAVVLVGGVPVDSAIFDAAYTLADATGMASSAPVLTLPTAAVPSNWRGAAVQVAAASYTATEHQPDGTGISLLVLRKA